MVTYRHIQILVNLFNDIQQKVLVPSMIAGSVIGQGVSLAFLINTPSTSESFPVLIVMAIVCVDTALLLIFCLRGFAEVHVESRGALRNIKSTIMLLHGRMQMKWMRRFLKSCGIIKMKFGSNNFVEMLTPLNCICQAAQVTVQILLLGASH